MADTPFIDSTISNNGFWPNIAVRPFFEGWRIQQDMQPNTMKLHLVSSMILVNEKLAKLQSIKGSSVTFSDYCQANGIEQLGGEFVAVTLYARAVYAFTKAELQRLSPTLSRKPIIEHESNAALVTEQDFRDSGQQAVSVLLSLFGLDVPGSDGAYFSAIGSH